MVQHSSTIKMTSHTRLYPLHGFIITWFDKATISHHLKIALGWQLGLRDRFDHREFIHIGKSLRLFFVRDLMVSSFLSQKNSLQQILSSSCDVDFALGISHFASKQCTAFSYGFRGRHLAALWFLTKEKLNRRENKAPTEFKFSEVLLTFARWFLILLDAGLWLQP